MDSQAIRTETQGDVSKFEMHRSVPQAAVFIGPPPLIISKPTRCTIVFFFRVNFAPNIFFFMFINFSELQCYLFALAADIATVQQCIDLYKTAPSLRSCETLPWAWNISCIVVIDPFCLLLSHVGKTRCFPIQQPPCKGGCCEIRRTKRIKISAAYPPMHFMFAVGQLLRVVGCVTEQARSCGVDGGF